MSEATARAVAAALLAAGCLKVRLDPPFRLVSGLNAPFYIDCRQLLGDPLGRDLVADFLAAAARGLPPADVIAGGVTAGVPFATLIADRLALPLAYIRGEAKAHGLGSQVEGAAIAGRRVLLVEDLVTTGDSSLKFAGVLRDLGAIVGHSLVVLDRSRDHCAARFADAQLAMTSLCTIEDLLDRAVDDGLVDPERLTAIRAFLDDPAQWSARHGG